MNLSDFIHDRLDDILVEWNAKAATLFRAGAAPARRAHAAKLLRTVADEMNRRSALIGTDGAPTAATSRLWPNPASAVVAEYAALRAAVLGQWRAQHPTVSANDLAEVEWFNATLDDSLAELLATIAPGRPDDLFLGVLAHEVRNAVSSIALSAQVQVRRDPPASASGKAAARILRSCEHLRSTLDALSEYSQLGLGKGLPLDRTQIDLATVCTDVVAGLDRGADHREVQIDMHGNLIGEWDEKRIRQILKALLMHASRSAKKNEDVVLTVDGDAKNSVNVTVSSSGMPLDVDTFREIFEPQIRLQSKKLTYGGLGLGLFIVREVVEAHEGQMRVDVAPDRGTTFTLILPRRLDGSPSRN